MNNNDFKKCALVTPTYVGHLCFIDNYLKSLSVYLEDKNLPIYLTIEEKDVSSLLDITQRYPNLNIKILAFEELLEANGVFDKPEDILKKYGRFSYQSLKKFYTLLSIDERYSLIVDSESMLVKKCDLFRIFQEYFEDPFVSYTLLSDRRTTDIFLENIVANSSLLLEDDRDAFYLENFVWFYDKKIVEELFQKIGQPIDLVQKLFEMGKKDLFEIQLYHQFIDINSQKYGYRINNIYKLLKENLSKDAFLQYLDKYYLIYKGNCGLVERVGSCVSRSNFKQISNLLKALNFNIIRSECHKDIVMNNKTIQRIAPCMLSASQDHSFGIKSNFRNKIMDFTDTREELPRLYNIIYSLKYNKFIQFIYFSLKILLKVLLVPIKNIFLRFKI